MEDQILFHKSKKE